MLNLRAAAHLLSRLPVRDKQTGTLVPFNLNANQQILLNRLQRRVDEGHQLPYWAVLPKARRVGVSSLSSGLGFCHCLERPLTEARIVAHLADTVEGLFKTPTDLYKALPCDMPRPLSRKLVFPHKEGESELTIGTAGTVTGGRGLTLSFLMFSEYAQMLGAAQALASLLSAISRTRNSIVIIESTAQGRTGIGEDFWRLWSDSVAGHTDFEPIFLSWLDDPTCRRDTANLANCPASDDEKDILAIASCPERCGRCARCHDARAAIAWMRWAVPNLCQNNIETFYREYPATSEWAFMVSALMAFTRDELRYARSSVRPPATQGRLESGVDGVTFIEADSPLKVWQRPVRGHRYYIGVDSARGTARGDYASAVVWDGDTGELAARYSNRVNPESLAKLVNLLGRWYNNAMLIIELTGNLGLWCQHILRDTLRYPNFYRWRGRDDRIYSNYSMKTSIGWDTNVRTRDMMLSAFKVALAYQRCKPYDDLLVTQMEAAEDEGGWWRVDESIHDDILVAAMIGWVAKDQWHIDNPAAMGTRQTDLGLTPGGSEEADRKVLPSTGSEPMQLIREHFYKMQHRIKHGEPVKRLEGI